METGGVGHAPATGRDVLRGWRKKRVSNRASTVAYCPWRSTVEHDTHYGTILTSISNIAIDRARVSGVQAGLGTKIAMRASLSDCGPRADHRWKLGGTRLKIAEVGPAASDSSLGWQ